MEELRSTDILDKEIKDDERRTQITSIQNLSRNS